MKFSTRLHLRSTILLALAMLVIVGNSLKSQTPRQIVTKDLTVQASVTIDKSGTTPKVVITWQKHELANSYVINKKLKGEPNWGFQSTTLDSSKLQYTDANVELGKAYEYSLNAKCNGSVHDNTLGKDSVRVAKFEAYSYLYAGVDLNPPGYQGKVLLLVEDVLSSEISGEISTLRTDLINEGWTPIIKYVARTEKFDKDAVKKVKDLIQAEYNKDKLNLNSVFIIGRVAVPYSGDNNPDGHPDHKGAWPCDLYYGSFTNEAEWTDTQVNDNSAGRTENKNIPGDGKFDQTQFGSNVVLRVGRVDFYDMGKFKDSETELIRKYLVKDHNFRTGLSKPNYRALISDNFGMYTFEAFGSSGWRNFASMLGPDNITSGTWFDGMKTDSYAWAYGCGGGTYTSAGGIGTTDDFATKPINAVFTMLFGSYFGDWDSQNNILRSVIASSPSTLTCCWSARPHWYFHHMGMNEPIGYSTTLSQNNSQTYLPNVFYLLAYPQGVIYASGMHQMHVALMGDPTLTLYPGQASVGMPANLQVTQPPFGYISIKWNAPLGGTVDGYNVYRSASTDGPFTQINNTLITGTEYNDSNLVDAKVYYMVRAGKLQTVNSGTYYQLSNGIYQNIVATDVEESGIKDVALEANPNPAMINSDITVSLPKPGLINLAIYNASGALVIDFGRMDLIAGTHSFSWNLRAGNEKVAPGVYFAKLTTSSGIAVAKIVVLP